MGDKPARRSRTRVFLDKLDKTDRGEFEQFLRDHVDLKLSTIEHVHRTGERVNVLQDKPEKYGEAYVAEMAMIVGVSTDRLYAFGRLAREISRERLTSLLDKARSEGFEMRPGHLEELARLKQMSGPDGRPLQESIANEICRRRTKVKALRKQVDELLGEGTAVPIAAPTPAPKVPPAPRRAAAPVNPVALACGPVAMPYSFRPTGPVAPPRPPKVADALAASVDQLVRDHSDVQARASELRKQIAGFDRGVAVRCADLVGTKLGELARSNQTAKEDLAGLLRELADKAGPAVLPDSPDEIVASAQESRPFDSVQETGDA